MKKIKLGTIILAIIVITMIAFFGVYVPVQNRMENKVKENTYAMDLKGTRNIRLTANKENQTIIRDSEGKEVTDADTLTEEEIAEKGYTTEDVPYNSEEILTTENYQKGKEIIEKRLNKLGVDNSTIKLDETTGDIVVEITDNEITDAVISNISTTGEFEIVDSETKEVLMNNDDIKLANVMYGSGQTTGTTSSGTAVYLNIEFTNEGAKKLEDISNQYVTIEETTEDSETEEETEEATQKEITMNIDGEEIMSTSFDEPLKTGKLQLSIGQATTDQATLQEYINQASSMATVLDTGKIPVKYEVSENQYILSDITEEDLTTVMIAGLVVIAIALVVFIIRYKTIGVISSISYIGLMSLLILIVKYANVVLSIEGIFGMAIILILNYLFINKLLGKLKGKELSKEELTKANKETYQEFFIKMIPICITVITFCFINWVPISSFGMVMFWGIALIALYNITITNTLLKIKAEK